MAEAYLEHRDKKRTALDRPVSLGRSSSCDIALNDTECSRRHALINPQAGGEVWIVDLGSTNGTLVNGSKIVGERALEPGDRIEVGGVVVTFCRVDASLAAHGAAALDRTAISFEPADAPAPSALRGDLAKIPMFAVLQMLEMGGQSGCLVVEGHDGECSLWLAKGRLLHAETAKARGMDAALEIAQTVHAG